MNLFIRLFRPFLVAWERFTQWLNGGPPGYRAQIVWVDADGVGWRERPDYMDGNTEDRGQHDIWKREMRIFLWRAVRGDTKPGALDLRDLGLGTRRINTSTLYPMGMQLAEACRRLGFHQLAVAAMPELEDGPELQAIWTRNEAAVIEEADRRLAHNQQTKATWDEARMGGPFVYEGKAETIALLTTGPFDRPTPGAPLAPIELAEINEGYAQFTAIKGGRS